ncbi:MAG: MBL fold metallo-hydrolase [Rikenellaceae bacterium]|nr:MBL fold metallo-hydrolase [Rikenellaceae bacterium]
MGQVYKSDRYSTPIGEIVVTPIAHGSIILEFQEKIIHVDPYSEIADYSLLPYADLILITHDHYDHLDKPALEKIIKPDTHIISTGKTAEVLPGIEILNNGDSTLWNGIGIKAVPAYNIKREKEPGKVFHPKGEGNGYLLDFGGFKIYIAGDTENIPELSEIKNPDIAFLPQMLPFTMDEEELIEAAKVVASQILYPYHYTTVDKETLANNLPEITIK